MNYLTKNYHAHTYRCHHATGSEREYIEKAIESGIKVFGFSDHTPQPYKNKGYVSRTRMTPSEAPAYADVINSLRDEYKDLIEIHLGVEAECYRENISELKDLLLSFGCEYALLSQHYTNNEYDGKYVGSVCDENELRQYVNAMLYAADTGLFSYFCHPDVINYIGNDKIYKDTMKEICIASNTLNMPLEINFLGLRDGRIYPGDRFFSIAAEYGCKVIYGIDAHDLNSIGNHAVYEEAEQFRKKYALELVDTIDCKLKNINNK